MRLNRRILLHNIGVVKSLLFTLILLLLGSGANPLETSARDSLHTSFLVHEDASVTITDTIRIESGNASFKNEFDRHLPPARRTSCSASRHSKRLSIAGMPQGRKSTRRPTKLFGDKGLMIRIGDFMNTDAIPQVRTYTLKYRLDNLIVHTALREIVLSGR